MKTSIGLRGNGPFIVAARFRDVPLFNSGVIDYFFLAEAQVSLDRAWGPTGIPFGPATGTLYQRMRSASQRKTKALEVHCADTPDAFRSDL